MSFEFVGKTMTEREYREHPALSRSSLWNIDESPEKFKWEETNPSEPTEALLLGQVFHKLVLEPETFESEFALEPNCDKRTKDGKEQYQAFLSSIGDKSVISAKVYTKALEMAQAVNNSRLAKALLTGEHEKCYFWTDEFTGVNCKCRLDCLRQIKDKLIIVDLKSATSSNTSKWIRDSLRFGYDVQVAMYSEGIKANYGVQPEFIFVVVEKEPPYSVNIFKSTQEYYDHGYDHYRSLIGLYKHCVDTNEWYGYMGEQETINDLALPSWAGGGE
jgi:exodeoxyribonuclease VIII